MAKYVSSKRVAFLAMAVLLVLGVTLSACSSNSASSASSTSSASPSASSSSSSAAAESDMLVLGTKTATAVSIVFTNDTGAAIDNLAIMPAGSTAEPTMLMASGQVLENGKKAQVFMEPTDAMLYDAVVAYGDKRSVLHDINVKAFDEARIALEGDVAYLRTVVDGNEVSSLREEYDRAHPAAPENEQAEAQESADSGQAESQSADDNNQAGNAGTGGGYSYYEEPAAASQTPAQNEQAPAQNEQAPAQNEQAPAQSEDACVSDIVLR